MPWFLEDSLGLLVLRDYLESPVEWQKLNRQLTSVPISYRLS